MPQGNVSAALRTAGTKDAPMLRVVMTTMDTAEAASPPTRPPASAPTATIAQESRDMAAREGHRAGRRSSTKSLRLSVCVSRSCPAPAAVPADSKGGRSHRKTRRAAVMQKMM
jgi:hypothetical protein